MTNTLTFDLTYDLYPNFFWDIDWISSILAYIPCVNVGRISLNSWVEKKKKSPELKHCIQLEYPGQCLIKYW